MNRRELLLGVAAVPVAAAVPAILPEGYTQLPSVTCEIGTFNGMRFVPPAGWYRITETTWILTGDGDETETVERTEWVRAFPMLEEVEPDHEPT